MSKFIKQRAKKTSNESHFQSVLNHKASGRLLNLPATMARGKVPERSWAQRDLWILDIFFSTYSSTAWRFSSWNNTFLILAYSIVQQTIFLHVVGRKCFWFLEYYSIICCGKINGHSQTENKDFTSLAQGDTFEIFHLKIFLVNLCSGVFTGPFHKLSISHLCLKFGGAHVSTNGCYWCTFMNSLKKGQTALYWTDLDCSLQLQIPAA